MCKRQWVALKGRAHTIGDDGVTDGEHAEELADDVRPRLVAPGPSQQPLVIKVEGGCAPVLRGRRVRRHWDGQPVTARSRPLNLRNARSVAHPRDGALEELHLVARQRACMQAVADCCRMRSTGTAPVCNKFHNCQGQPNNACMSRFLACERSWVLPFY